MIRGGGDRSQFEVFDQKAVLQAWVANPTFKAVGLGRKGTGATLIEFVSDYVGGTPTAVGSFLAQQITRLDQQRRAAIAGTGATGCTGRAEPQPQDDRSECRWPHCVRR